LDESRVGDGAAVDPGAPTGTRETSMVTHRRNVKENRGMVNALLKQFALDKLCRYEQGRVENDAQEHQIAHDVDSGRNAAFVYVV